MEAAELALNRWFNLLEGSSVCSFDLKLGVALTSAANVGSDGSRRSEVQTGRTAGVGRKLKLPGLPLMAHPRTDGPRYGASAFRRIEDVSTVPQMVRV